MRKLYFLALIVFSGLMSCRFMGKRIHGNGVIKTIEKPVSAFKQVDAGGNVKLIVTQGDLKPVKLEGDENLLSYIEVIQDGDRITIKTRDNVELDPSNELNVYVSSPSFTNIEVSGASDIVGANKITGTEDLSVQASGAGDIKMEVDVPKISAGISGTGNIALKGQTKDLEIDISGAGHANCYDLLTENTSVQISGVGSAQVYASVKLDAHVSGAGNIHYKGNASVSQEISGAGSVDKAD
jgi:hypothetical protein